MTTMAGGIVFIFPGKLKKKILFDNKMNIDVKPVLSLLIIFLVLIPIKL